jgi:hypothetical protein
LAFAGVSCHYNLLPLAAAIALGSWRLLPRRVAIAGIAGFVAALLVLQAGTFAADRILVGIYPEYQSYAGELRHNFFSAQTQTAGEERATEQSIPAARRDGIRGNDLAAWSWVARRSASGFGMALLLGAWGTFALLRRRNGQLPEFLPILLAAWLPLLVWGLYPWKVERSLVTAVPGLCLAAGVGLAPAASWSPLKRRLLLALVSLGAGGSLFLAIQREIPGASPFAGTVANLSGWISRAPAGSFTSRSFHWRQAPVWKWYLGPERINRGLASPGIDFSSRELPLVVVRDSESDLPDGNFAGQSPEFRSAIPLPGSLFANDYDAAGVFLLRPDSAAAQASLDPPAPDLNGSGS